MLSRHLPRLSAASNLRRALSSAPAAGRGGCDSDGNASDFDASASDSGPPLADEIFRSARRTGGYTQGDATYLALARAYADREPPDLPALRGLLARMRSERPRPFPESVFIPILRALGRVGRPLAAVRLFHRLLPSFGCSPSVRSLNSALSALLSAPGGHNHHRLALSFFSCAVRRHPSLAPNLLTFNLLLKSLCRSGDLPGAIRLLRHLPHRGLRPDAYSYSTLIAALSAAGQLTDALALLDEMLLDGVPPAAPAFNAIIAALCR
ncbi:hypothetical protein GW17_00028469, partial [Ensete ventricosum]